MPPPAYLSAPLLALASAYLTTSPPHTTFAADKPLHTSAFLLALAAALILAAEPSAKLQTHFDSSIPLRNRNQHQDAAPTHSYPHPHPPLRFRPTLTTLTLLLALLARIAIAPALLRGAACSARAPTPFLPFALVLVECVRGLQRAHTQASAWSHGIGAGSRGRGRILALLCGRTTRYVVPAALVGASLWVIQGEVGVIPSTVVCGVGSGVGVLSAVGFVIECGLLVGVGRVVGGGRGGGGDDGEEREGGENVLGVGMIFAAASLVLLFAGMVVYAALPDHRQWMLEFSPEYMRGLFRLSLMIPFTTLCFLNSARLYGVMSAVLIAAFPSAFISVLRALGTTTSYSFPPKSTGSLLLCIVLLTVALLVFLVTDTNIETCIRTTIPIRLGRNHSAVAILLLVGFSCSIVVYRYETPGIEHPISTLIRLADIQHEQWESQACRSQSLAEAVVHYRQRYDRDPPPNFDHWHRFAVSRSSIVIDDYDNIEQDLAPFSSFSPEDLRLRTADVLATQQDIGGIQVRQGKVAVLANVSADRQWKMDGVVSMIQPFAEFLPDMDLAMNLNDESRVAIPYDDLQDALANPQPYPTPSPSRPSKGFSTDRAAQWLDVDKTTPTPRLFQDARFKPSFMNYGSIACSLDSRARKERHWDTKSLCTSCAAPHSHGAFVANWSLSADPCHQPDMANLHGMYLSPTNFSGTHAVIPLFSQSRAPGFNDIRYPSPWHYLDKTKYEFDEKSPDAHFADKEDVLFWRGAPVDGYSIHGTWQGMLPQRLTHLLNNATVRHPILLPSGAVDNDASFSYVLERADTISQRLRTRTDVALVAPPSHCSVPDCAAQASQLAFQPPVPIKHHWRYRYLFAGDDGGAHTTLLPFLQSNSVVLHASVARAWFEGRLVAWRHFVPVDQRLHDVFSSLAYFGGYGYGDPDGDGDGDPDGDGDNTGGLQDKHKMRPRLKEAEAIARQGRVWADKVLRREDMEVYMFRLLLEWGRLTDDARTDVGFRMGKGERW